MYKDADAKIIEILEKDASLTNREIGEKLGLPTTTVHNKIRRMEKEGIIKRYAAIFDKQKIGLPITALIAVNTTPSNSTKSSHKELADKIKKLGKVDCILSVTGDYDLMIRLSLASTQELNDFVMRLRKVEGISKTVTNIVLEDLEWIPF